MENRVSNSLPADVAQKDYAMKESFFRQINTASRFFRSKLVNSSRFIFLPKPEVGAPYVIGDTLAAEHGGVIFTHF